MFSTPYPIAEILPALLTTLADHSRVVLEAPPGAGKTTQVPLALLQAPWCRGKILMLEPRRIAARAAATFMAAQLAEPVGATVGYRIRFERKISAQTRIEIVTEGILTRLLQEDPSLPGVDAVIFDEFHERHLASDLGLALCLDVQASLRPELRLVVMSATLDGERIARFLNAPRLTSAGKSYPVEVEYVARRAPDTPEVQLKRAVELALNATDGDILCFLPGKAEIDRATRLLGSLGIAIESLHGELSIADQARLLNVSDQRRLVLATNVAESSVTLPGVRAVIDTGLAREPRFDPSSGMSRLETVTIAQSSATQRAGRAGRTGPGRCYRLWPASQRLDPATRPELHRLELSAFRLETKVWGAAQLQFLDPPPPGTLAQADEVLRALGVHPRLANAMLRAPPEMQGLACDLAALLEARDPLRGEAQKNDDLRVRLDALWRLRRGDSAPADLARGVLNSVEQASQQWQRRLNLRSQNSITDSHAAGTILALAYPDRVAKMDESNSRRYQTSNGRGAMLRHDSTLVGAPWLAIAEIRYDERDSLIQRAAPLDLASLRQHFAHQFTHETQLAFNADSRAVETHDVARFDAIVLERRRITTARSPDTADRLCAGIATLGLAALPWSEALREWQARVECLREWCPALDLPAMNDATLATSIDTWLRPLLDDKTRLADLDETTFGDGLRLRLDYQHRKLVDEQAPTEILVPSGLRRKLHYAIGQSPVLAVKLQELFGLADTPRIAQGRVPVTLHLLSPRQTPIQVTQDLRGFWDRTYPAVKRELQGRYPKHPWPDDPWTATATHRAKPRTNSTARNG
jgi:ATP-dependent helicase HrpB